MPRHHLSRRQYHALRRVMHGSVRRMLEDVHAFEVHPHWMGRIRKPAGSERIRRQKIAVLVGDDGLADRQHRQKERARGQSGNAREEDGQGASPRQVNEHAPDGAESGCR